MPRFCAFPTLRSGRSSRQQPSMQKYILSAAYDRATAVERRFLDGFKASMARSGAAFAAEPGSLDPSVEQRAAGREAQRELDDQERGHAARPSR